LPEDEDVPLVEIASRLGYESETAFGRAFKRILGFPPGAARRSTGRPMAILVSGSH
jgi:AraC-like DNA-binding protein